MFGLAYVQTKDRVTCYIAVAYYQPSSIVVRSADLRELVQAALQTEPLVPSNGYLIFPVPDPASQPTVAEGNCPLRLGTGVGTRP